MKIQCSTCHKDISTELSKNFAFQGTAECPECAATSRLCYRIHSYSTAMGSYQDNGIHIGKSEILDMIQKMISINNPPCEIHLTLQTQ